MLYRRPTGKILFETRIIKLGSLLKHPNSMGDIDGCRYPLIWIKKGLLGQTISVWKDICKIYTIWFLELAINNVWLLSLLVSGGHSSIPVFMTCLYWTVLQTQQPPSVPGTSLICWWKNWLFCQVSRVSLPVLLCYLVIKSSPWTCTLFGKVIPWVLSSSLQYHQKCS